MQVCGLCDLHRAETGPDRNGEALRVVVYCAMIETRLRAQALTAPRRDAGGNANNRASKLDRKEGAWRGGHFSGWGNQG